MKKLLRFTKKGLNSDSSNTTKPENTDITSAKWYRNIYELPLTRFIDAHVNNNLLALVITGNPTSEELHLSWLDINLEYADTIKNKDYKAMAIVQSEMACNEIVYNQILGAIGVLKDYYVPWFKNFLNKILRMNYKFDVHNRDQYDAELKNAVNRSKGIMLDIKLKKMEMDAIQAKLGESAQPASQKYFHSMLVTLENRFKRDFDIDKLTVYKFCENIRIMNEEFEHSKNISHGI